MTTENDDKTKPEAEQPRRKRAPRPGATYKVGYCRPPNLFQKGQSGNPRGRPRKESRAMTEQQVRKDLLEAMEQPITVTKDGKKQSLPIILVIYNRLLLKAAQGDYRSAKLVIELRKQLIDEHISVKVRLAEQLLEMEKHFEQHPEDEQGENVIGPWIQEMARRAWDPDVIA